MCEQSILNDSEVSCEQIDIELAPEDLEEPESCEPERCSIVLPKLVRLKIYGFVSLVDLLCKISLLSKSERENLAGSQLARHKRHLTLKKVNLHANAS
jgi:hypothetical protein